LPVTMCVVRGIVNFETSTKCEKKMQKAYNFESNMCDYQDVAIFHTITP
jgi:hypothetical protein